MTTELLEHPSVALPFDPIAAAIADVESLPEPTVDAAVRTRELVIVSWSGELDRVWPMLILSSTAAASGLRARVFVTLKPSVFDPQGRTIVDALHSLGYNGVEDVRQGKYIGLELNETDKAKAKARLEDMCKKLLANTVIENYSIELV